VNPNEYSPKDIARFLKQLRLKGMAEVFGERYGEAMAQGMGILEFLGRLMEEELDGRRQRRFERLVKDAKLFPSDSIETYDMDLARAHGVDPALVRDLVGCDYIRKPRNIVLAGAVGTGKTRLARTLAFEAARRDFRVIFARTAELVDEFYRQRNSLGFPKLYKKYVTAHAIYLDDLAYLTFDPEKVEYLFRLIFDRTEKKTGPIIVTTNSDVREWWKYFPSKAMGMAFSDRVLGGAIGIRFTGPSIRSNPDGDGVDDDES